jgi:hypothetical protein
MARGDMAGSASWCRAPAVTSRSSSPSAPAISTATTAPTAPSVSRRRRSSGTRSSPRRSPAPNPGRWSPRPPPPRRRCSISRRRRRRVRPTARRAAPRSTSHRRHSTRPMLPAGAQQQYPTPGTAGGYGDPAAYGSTPPAPGYPQGYAVRAAGTAAGDTAPRRHAAAERRARRSPRQPGVRGVVGHPPAGAAGRAACGHGAAAAARGDRRPGVLDITRR